MFRLVQECYVQDVFINYIYIYIYINNQDLALNDVQLHIP